MAYSHARVYYGKYIDAIDTLIDPAHYIIDEFSDVGHSLEAGEPNVPTADKASITLANLDPEGNQRYPFSFWLNARRKPEEGGTLTMEIFFRIEVGGQTEFIGVYGSTSYGIRDEKVTITIKDLSDILKQDQRHMLKTFKLQDQAILDVSKQGTNPVFNTVPPLKDHVGSDVTHETITFQLMGNFNTILGDIFELSDVDRRLTFKHPFMKHLGITSFDDEVDVTRNMFIQIGETTIFTKCRYWIDNDVDDKGNDGFLLTIWHNGEDIVEDVVPRGRFYENDDLDPITAGGTGRISITIHDYAVPSAKTGEYNSKDIVITDADLPAYRNYIFGCSYVESGGNIHLRTERYSYFDVIEQTLNIFEDYFARRFGSGAQSGTIEVLNDAPSAVGAGSKASFDITITAPTGVPEDITFGIICDNDYWNSNLVELEEGMVVGAIENEIVDAINNGPSSINWVATIEGPENIHVESKENTARFNGFTPRTSPQFIVDDILSFSAISGGADDEVASGINIKVGDDVDVTTVDITASQTKESIATLIKDTLEADATFNANYTASIDGAVVTINKNTAGIKANVEVDPLTSGVEVDATNIFNRFELFDLSKLIKRNRKAFYADPMFFGWIDKSLVEILVGCAWQTTAYLYTTSDGAIALHSRDWYEENIDEVYIDAGSFSQTTLLDQDLEPLTGIERENGYKSYSFDEPLDMIEINNVVTEETEKIIVGGIEVTQEVEVISRDGTTEIVEQTFLYPSSKDQNLKTSNFRKYDLGVPSQNEVANPLIPILRLSPADPAWPHSETIKDFLPTARQQLTRFYNSFKWPVETIKVETFRPWYPNLKIGDYVALENLNLYLVKELTVNPASLTMNLELEFKKGLINESITWDSDAITLDSTNETFDHT